MDNSSSRSGVSSSSMAMMPPPFKFANAGDPVLYGRTEQVAALRNLLGSRHQVCMVQGTSGVGKTSLIRSALQHYAPIEAGSYCYCETKFDPLGKPYAVFIELVTLLCQELTAEQQEELQEKVGEDAQVLVHTIPYLATMFGHDDSAGTSLTAKEHFYSAYRKLIYSLINVSEKSVNIVLDDLQWADADSLNLIRHLVHYLDHNTNLLLIGVYRDNEVRETDGLYKLLKEIESRQSIVYIKVESLPLQSVHEWISNALEMAKNETLDLAQATMKKTMGNIFYSMQFLESLRARRQLEFDPRTHQWMWDIRHIQESNLVSDSVVDLVMDRMTLLDLRLQQLLKTAACLGTLSPKALLERILRDVYQTEVDGDDYKVLAKESFMVETKDSGWIAFVHDRIQQAAMSLDGPQGISGESSPPVSLHWSIGNSLATMHKEGEDIPGVDAEWILFACTDQLNRGASCVFDNPHYKLLLAELNLQAGETAKDKAAFAIAASYADSGYDNLTSLDMWTTNYDLSLGLTNLGAENAYLSGNDAFCDRMEDVVVKNATCLDDKLRVYQVRVQKIFARGKTDEAIDESLRILRLLGYRLSKRPNLGHALAGVAKLGLSLNRKPEDFIMSLPPMKDARQLAAMKFLAYAGSYSGVTNNPALENILVTATVKILQETLKHGLSHFTPVALSHYSAVLACLGNSKGACRYGRLALRFINETPFVEHASWTINVTMGYAGSLFRVTPIEDSLALFLKGYKAGVRGGFLEDAVLSSGNYCQAYVLNGKSLTRQLHEFDKYVAEMKVYKQVSAYERSVPLLQFCYNLLLGDGQVIDDEGNVDPTILTGRVMNQDELSTQIQISNNSMALGVLIPARIELCYHFGNLNEAIRLLNEYQKVCSKELAVVLGNGYTNAMFFTGLVSFAMVRLARNSRIRRTYLCKGQGCIALFQSYIKLGAPLNCWNDKILLLQAEQLSLQHHAPFDNVKRLYLKAASCANQKGDNRTLALSLELLGEYILAKQGDGLPYLAESAIYYSHWGALAKVKDLERKYGVVAEAHIGLDEY